MSEELFQYIVDLPTEFDLLKNRIEYEQRFLERFKVLESDINLIMTIKNKAKDSGTDEHVLIWNSFGYLTILSYDLVSAGFYLLFETKQWQKVYFARQVVLLIYESMNDIPTIIGKNFKKIFTNIPEAQAFNNQLKLLSKKFQIFREENLETLREIRMNAIGHRDPDIDKQLSNILSINPYSIITIMYSFDKIIREISDHLKPLVIHSIKLND